jgi:hypothetical protein
LPPVLQFTTVGVVAEAGTAAPITEPTTTVPNTSEPASTARRHHPRRPSIDTYLRSEVPDRTACGVANTDGQRRQPLLPRVAALARRVLVVWSRVAWGVTPNAGLVSVTDRG